LEAYKINQALEQIQSEAYEVLEQLINTNSFTANAAGIKQTASCIVDAGKRHGIKFQPFSTAGEPGGPFHLLYDGRDRADSTPFYALIGHYDTVHKPQSPFDRFRSEGERLYGPGILDMKAGVLTALYAVAVTQAAAGVERLPIKILFNCDEETGSRDSSHMIKKETADAAGAFVFEGRRDSDHALVTARKGILMGSMQVYGRAAHAGEEPEKGASAIVEAAGKILRLNGLIDPESGTVVNVGKVTGGTVANQIPDYCSAQIDVRFKTQADCERISRQIADIMAETAVNGTRTAYELVTARPPFVQTAEARLLLDRYKQAASEFGVVLSERSAGGGSDANLTAALGVPSLDGLGPEGDGAHTSSEYIVRQSFVDGIKVFALFLSRLIINH
jgi:glutamate carboxypeptidase